MLGKIKDIKVSTLVVASLGLTGVAAGSTLMLNNQVVKAADTTNTATKTATADQGVEKELFHNAYIYDQNGQRTNDVALKTGTKVATYGTKIINGRKFYSLGQDLYLAAGNIDNKTWTVTHNSVIYNQYGEATSQGKLKGGTSIATYGDPVVMHGEEYYSIGNDQFVKKADLNDNAATPQRPGYIEGIVVNGNVKRDTYIYDQNGQRTNKLILSVGSMCYAAVSETINGQEFYEFGNGERIPADNIDGTKRGLTHNAYIYNRYGQRVGRQVVKAGQTLRTYGKPVTIKNKAYYTIDNNRYVKQANFN